MVCSSFEKQLVQLAFPDRAAGLPEGKEGKKRKEYDHGHGDEMRPALVPYFGKDRRRAFAVKKPSQDDMFQNLKEQCERAEYDRVVDDQDNQRVLSPSLAESKHNPGSPLPKQRRC